MTATSCVTVSCVATASSRMVESRARRFLPFSTPVSATTVLTASKIRFGAGLAASRRRQYVRVDGSNPACPIGRPHATFHRRSVRTAAIASRSDNPSRAWRTRIDAAMSTGTEGRPRPDGKRSANIASANSTRRCSANNQNTLPWSTR